MRFIFPLPIPCYTFDKKGGVNRSKLGSIDE